MDTFAGYKVIDPIAGESQQVHSYDAVAANEVPKPPMKLAVSLSLNLAEEMYHRIKMMKS